MMKNIKIVLCLAALLGARDGLAKGLEDLNPATPQEKEAEPAKKDAEPATENKEGPKAEPVEKKEEKKDEPAAATTAATNESKTIEPSATSRKLADKLSLSTGLYFNRLKGSTGTWAAGGGRSEIAVSYLTAKEPYKSGFLKHVDILASLRYAPVDVTVKSKKQSYRGVVEGFHLGGLLSRLFNENFRSIGGVELSYFATHLRSLDALKEEAAVTKNGAGVTLVGGCDWIFSNKLTLGPRVDVSLGSYSGFSFGGAAGFIF